MANDAQPNHLLSAVGALSPPRLRKSAVERNAVVDAALRIVVDENLGALTMRRLAQELGVGLASIYAAVGNKEVILNELVEEILSRLPEVTVDATDWEQQLVDLLGSLHELFLDHSAVAHLALLRRITGSISLSTQDTILKLLRAGGLDEPSMAAAYSAITSYVMGFTMLRISRLADDDAEGLRGFSVQTFEEAGALASSLDAQMSTEGFLAGLRHLIHSYAASGGDNRSTTPAASSVRPKGARP